MFLCLFIFVFTLFCHFLFFSLSEAFFPHFCDISCSYFLIMISFALFWFFLYHFDFNTGFDGSMGHSAPMWSSGKLLPAGRVTLQS